MIHRLPWYPGYTVAGVATLGLFASAPGQTFVISLLNSPLRETFGIGELTLNSAYTAATVAAAFPLVLVGRLTDRFGPRRMLALTALAFGLGCMAMGAAAGPATVFVGFFLLRFLGQGSLTLVSQHAVAMWFHRRLGSVHGVKLVVAFGAWVAVPQIASAMIDSLGWRQTYIAFGLAIWAAIIPLALLLVRDRPEDLGLRMDNESNDQAPALDSPATAAPAAAEPGFTLPDAARTRAYWTVAAATFLAPLIGTGILFDLHPMLAARGLTPDDATNAVSIWTAAMCLMSLPAGYLTDRVHPAAVLSLGTGMVAVACLLLLAATGFWTVAAAMVAFAVGQAVVMGCSTATIARYYGRAHHGAIRSSISRIGVVGTGLGTIVTGLSMWATDAYTAALWAFAIMCLPVVVLTAGLRPPTATLHR